MQLKNISAKEVIVLSKLLDEWETFFASKNYIDPSIKELTNFIITLLRIEGDYHNKETYLDAMKQLTTLIAILDLEKIDPNTELYERKSLLLKETAELNKNDLGTNFIRLLFATFYRGTDSSYLDKLLTDNPKSTCLNYLKLIIDDLKDKKEIQNNITELACVLATEINAQKNDFCFAKFIGLRSFALHFENFSLFVLIEKSKNTEDLNVSYVEVFNIRKKYFRNVHQNIIIKNIDPDLLSQKPVKEVLLQLMKSGTFLLRLFKSLATAQQLK